MKHYIYLVEKTEETLDLKVIFATYILAQL